VGGAVAPPPALPPAAPPVAPPPSPPSAPFLLRIPLPPFNSTAIDGNGTTAVAANSTLVHESRNATDAAGAVDEQEDELARLCHLWKPAAYVHLAALPLWVMLVCWWVLFSLRHEQHVQDLHKLLSWVPLVELAHALLSAFHFLFCPWRSMIQKVWGAAWVVVSILKEPIMLVCLLMLAKGWCITRQRLQYKEVVHSSLLITLLYMCVIIELSSTGVATLVPTILMFGVMLGAVVSAILVNLRVLKAQLLVLRAFSGRPHHHARLHQVPHVLGTPMGFDRLLLRRHVPQRGGSSGMVGAADANAGPASARADDGARHRLALPRAPLERPLQPCPAARRFHS